MTELEILQKEYRALGEKIKDFVDKNTNKGTTVFEVGDWAYDDYMGVFKVYRFEKKNANGATEHYYLWDNGRCMCLASEARKATEAEIIVALITQGNGINMKNLLTLTGLIYSVK